MPTTSVNFSSNCLSVESLNFLTRWGLMPRPDQIFWTVSRLTPWRSAMVRQLQCVSPAGLVCRVSWTMAAILVSEIKGLRPRPSRISPSLVQPTSVNRFRQAPTVVGETASAVAMVRLGTPSPASSSACARTTSRWAAVLDLAMRSRTPRSVSPSSSAGTAAGILGCYHVSSSLADTTLASTAPYVWLTGQSCYKRLLVGVAGDRLVAASRAGRVPAGGSRTPGLPRQPVPDFDRRIRGTRAGDARLPLDTSWMELRSSEEPAIRLAVGCPCVRRQVVAVRG